MKNTDIYDVSIEHIYKSYNGKSLFSDFSLSLRRGARTALTGVSGCGKTTLLNMIMGLASPDSGNIYIADDCALQPVFQEDRLIEGMTALGNLNIFRGAFDSELARRILSGLSIDDALVSCAPISQYSGGMKRRCAVARALYGCLHAFPAKHSLLLLDEPFKGLDDALRRSVISCVNEVITDTGASLIMVTHEKEEAAALGCDLITLG